MTSKCVTLALVLLSAATLYEDVSAEITSDQMKYFYQTVLSVASYDKRVRPNQASEAVTIKVSLYIIRLFDLDHADSSVKVSLYFRQLWQDGRLAHSGDGTMIGGGDLSDMIWKPDTMFSTSSQGSREETTLPNTFVRISPNGSVFHSVKLNQDIDCQQHVRSFPMDSLTCKIVIESCEYLMFFESCSKLDFKSDAYSANDVTFEWIPGGILLSQDDGVGEFRVDHEVQNKTEIITLSTGNFTTLSVTLQLERNAMPYLIKYFVPLIVTSVLCMIPIADPKNKSLAVLISFLLTSIITVLTSMNVVPKGGVVTAFDVFGMICILFTAVALVFTLRKSSDTEGSTYKLSEREEKIEQQMKKLMPIAFASFLLLILLLIVCA